MTTNMISSQSFTVLRHFTRQELIDRHGGTALGAAWTLLVPLANILIFTLVFSRLMGARLDTLGVSYLGPYSYSVYLVSGLLAWLLFAGTISRITNVYIEKAGLITKVRLSLRTLPLFIVASEFAVFFISLAFFVVFLLAIDFRWTMHWMWLPVILAVQQLFAFGLGLFFATISVFLRDTGEAVNVALQFWFWLTPIVYVADIIPDHLRFFLSVNPLYHTTSALRATLIAGQTPQLSSLAAVALLGVGVTAGALWLNRRMEKDLRDLL
jgi:lipopolysaccharide transport system permease protein